jgi:hypothetical protein
VSLVDVDRLLLLAEQRRRLPCHANVRVHVRFEHTGGKAYLGLGIISAGRKRQQKSSDND